MNKTLTASLDKLTTHFDDLTLATGARYSAVEDKIFDEGYIPK